MKINKWKILICLLILIAIVGISIYFIRIKNKKDTPDSIEVNYEKTNMITNFRLGVSNFDTINPVISQNKDIIQISSLIFEPLLKITQNYKIENNLTKEWSKVSAKDYIIKLKENVKWHDNTEFNSDDVKFTIEAIKKNKKSVYFENVKDIKNVNIVDKYTLRLELQEEVPFFEYKLIFPILSKKQYENKDMGKSTLVPLGTGKYKIAKLGKDAIEIVKNEKWYEIEEENSNIKTITISIYDTMGEVYNSFKLGNIDLISTNNINYEEYIGSMGYQKKQFKGREYDYLAFNCNNSVLTNIEVRQAIQKVINKEEILSTVFEKNAYVADFPLDYGSYLIEGINLNIAQNKNEAKSILQDAGWKYEYGLWSKNIDGKTKTLNFNLTVSQENKQRLKVAEKIKEQLENFGIKINIQKLSEVNYQKVLKDHQYEIILTGVYSGYSPELNGFFGENNLANYQNSEIDALLKDINTISSEDLQKEKYKKIIEIYQKEVPYLGLYRNQVTVAYGQSVMGDVTPNNYSIFYQFSNWYRQ